MTVEDINLQLKRGKNKITVPSENLISKYEDGIITQEAINTVKKIAEQFKENMIYQIRSSLPSGSKISLKQGLDNDIKLRDEVIKAIESATLEIKTTDAGTTFSLVVDSENFAMLNDGTGIYNKDNPHIITPKPGKKYMFIPGIEFAKGLIMGELKKKGMSSEDARKTVRSEVRGRRKQPKVNK